LPQVPTGRWESVSARKRFLKIRTAFPELGEEPFLSRISGEKDQFDCWRRSLYFITIDMEYVK
jgi:hypothetical protein